MAQAPPSTAEVIEFRCQYTHNVVQKKKKWNDGCLKFHTFNKLVRVFDEDSNHVGQKHWQGGEGLQDGDEFQLDNMLVCVQDVLRSTQTNIAPLFDKRRKQLEDHRLSSPSGAAASRLQTQVHAHRGIPSQGLSGEPRPSTIARSQHKSLSDLLGKNRRPVGKATVPISPFAERHRSDDHQNDEGSPAKRRRINLLDDAPWTVTTTSIPRKPNAPQAQAITTAGPKQQKPSAKKSKAVKTPASQKTLRIKSVVDLTAESSPSQETGPNHRPNDRDADASIHKESEQSIRSITANARPMRNGCLLIAPEPPSEAGPSMPRNAQHETTRSISDEIPTANTASAANRKALSLSNTKRKSTLMCMATSSHTAANRTETTGRTSRTFGEADNLESECENDRPPATWEGNGNAVRPPLQEVSQPSNALRRKREESGKLSRQGDMLPPSNVTTRKGFGRSQSDPSKLTRDMNAGSDSPIEPGHSATSIAKKYTSLRRAQTLTAATGEFQIPASIFTQLPPEIDRDKDDLGPWSREAFDLFDWRPPDWEHRLASRPSALAMVD